MTEYSTETCGLHDCGTGCVPMPMAVATQRDAEINAGLGIAPWEPGQPVRMARTDYGPHLYEVPEWWTL